MLSRQAIERAAAVLCRGEAAILPTDTVPGLFIKDTPTGEEKLRRIKVRASGKPFARMFASKGELKPRVKLITQLQKLAVEKLLPGKVTLILPSGKGKEDIGVRIPDDASLRALLEHTGPLIATSANLSGEILKEPDRLSPQLLEKVALVEEDGTGDAGEEPKLASTVIDITGDRPLILRKGAVSIWEVEKKLGLPPFLPPPAELNILFVCGGNTCRSPLAAAIFKRQFGLQRVQARSAGLTASEGMPAHPNARKAASELGVSLDSHRSRRLDRNLMSWADAVLVMTREHYRKVKSRYPALKDKVFLLGGFPRTWPHGRNIPDPLGSSLATYRETAEQIVSYMASIFGMVRRVLSDAD